MWRLILTLFLFVAACSPPRADVERFQRLGNLEARLVLETAPQTPDAGDRIDIRLSGEVLNLEITGPANLDVTAPEPILLTKNWQSAKARPDEIATLPDGRRRWRGFFRIDPDRPGPASLQFAALKTRAGEDQQLVQWPSLAVTVVTSIQRVAPDELIEDAPLQPYEGWQESSFKVPAWLAGVMLAGGFATLGGLRYRRSRRLRLEQPEPWIRRHVAQLRAQNLDSPEKITRFYGELADLLRHYIERRYALPAPNRTTREFLGDIQGGAALDGEQRAVLERFLGRCDLVKFARQAPSLADCDAAVELVLRFVEERVSAN